MAGERKAEWTEGGERWIGVVIESGPEILSCIYNVRG